MCKIHNPSRIDRCMKNLVFRMKSYGIKTLACCCGHKKYPMTIIVKDCVGIYDIVSDIALTRKKRFYVKDKQGYYYIPEVIARNS